MMTIEPKSGQANSRNARYNAQRCDSHAKPSRDGMISARQPDYESGSEVQILPGAPVIY
jgi:hypothetical protein